MSLTQYNCHQTLPFSFYLFKFHSFHFSLATWNSNFTQNNNNNDEAEKLTSKVHDPYARTTGA